VKSKYRLLLVAVIAFWMPQPGFALLPHWPHFLHLPHLPHLGHKKKSPTPKAGEKAPATNEEQNAPAAGREQNAPAATEEQNPPAAPATIKGPTAFAQVAAMRTEIGTVYNEGIGVGYNLSDHLGGDIGFSLYNVQSPYTIVTNHDWRWTTLAGDPFIDLRYAIKTRGLNVVSILTGTVPISSPERVFSTGRFGVDWFNHIETHYGGLTPFVNLGAANESVDRYILPRPYDIARPYQTLGFMANFEGGASYTIFRNYSIGASAYAVVPSGTQKVFSRLVAPDSTVSGDASHFRYWNNAFETVGDSQIDRDNGYSGWVDIHRLRNLTIEVGYTYSVHYHLGSAFLMLRYDGTSLIRFLTATE
jgi:hypothetical protein